MKQLLSIFLIFSLLFLSSCGRPVSANKEKKKQKQKQPNAQQEHQEHRTQKVPQDKIPQPPPIPKGSRLDSMNKSVPGEPDIDFDKRDFDLGMVEPGVKKEAIVKVYNRGAKDLVIERIKSSCGCTAAWLQNQKDPLKPGESRELKVVLTPKQGQKTTKSVITFYSNDPAEKRTMIRTEVSTKEYFKASPQMVNFGDVIQGQPSQAKVTIFSLDNTPFKIVRSYCPEPGVIINAGQLQTIGNQGQGIPIEITFDSATRRIGIFRSFVQVITDHPKQKIIHVQLYGKVGGEVFFSTANRPLNVPYFDIGTIDNVKGVINLPPTRTLKMGIQAGSTLNNLKILHIDAEKGPMSVEATETVPGREFEFKIINSGEGYEGMFRQKFRVMVNNPRVPVYEVYIQGMLQNRFKLSSEGVYIETAANQPFQGLLNVRLVKHLNKMDFEVRGGNKLQYELNSPDPTQTVITVRGNGAAESFLEEVVLFEKTTGQAFPIMVWVEVTK